MSLAECICSMRLGALIHACLLLMYTQLSQLYINIAVLMSVGQLCVGCEAAYICPPSCKFNRISAEALAMYCRSPLMPRSLIKTTLRG